MKLWNGFGRSLLFALLCALGWPFFCGATAAWLGVRLAVAIYLVLVTATYVFGIASRRSPAVSAAATVVLSGGLLILLGAGPIDLVWVLASLLGVLRSGLLFRPEATASALLLRRLLRELFLLGAGLGLAFLLLRGASTPIAAALWGFFLIQSGFFLLRVRPTRSGEGGWRAPDRAGRVDPFEQACARARTLLDPDPAMAAGDTKAR